MTKKIYFYKRIYEIAILQLYEIQINPINLEKKSLRLSKI